MLWFTAAITLFHFANAAMLPLAGEKLSQGKPDASPLFMASCVITAQLVMAPIAILVGRKADAWGRKPIFLAGFAVLPVRGLLFALSDDPYFIVAIEILDGVDAGFGGAVYIVVSDFTTRNRPLQPRPGRSRGKLGSRRGAQQRRRGDDRQRFRLLGGILLSRRLRPWRARHVLFRRTRVLVTIARPRPERNGQPRCGRDARMTMDAMTAAQAETWSIAAFATSGVILRPWGLPEAIWVVAGATALVLSALLPWQDALAAVSRGTDVYLFLTGMMLLAEVARREGLFDWLAVHATEAAKGSPTRLFGLIYAVGILVTAFMSNDATAVVLTPAVYAAAARQGKAVALSRGLRVHRERRELRAAHLEPRQPRSLRQPLPPWPWLNSSPCRRSCRSQRPSPCFASCSART